VQTTRLHESFLEGSNSSRAYSRGSFLYQKCRQWEAHALSAIFGILCTTGFLAHNFGSRHARRSTKGSIDADDYLVSKTILRHKNGSLD